MSIKLSEKSVESIHELLDSVKDEIPLKEKLGVLKLFVDRCEGDIDLISQTDNLLHRAIEDAYNIVFSATKDMINTLK